MYLLEGESEEREYQPQESVFADLRAAGYRSGLVGYYLPYCRLFRTYLEECYRTPHSSELLGLHQTELLPSISYFFSRLTPFPSGQNPYFHANVEAAIEQSLRLVARADLDFVFIHLPIPHPPWTFNRKTSSVVPADTNGLNYLDGLAYANQALQRVIERMEETAANRETILIVTSDHSNYDHFDFGNTLDERIPFFIKFPGQSKESNVSRKCNSLHLSRVIKSLLKEGIPKDVSRWIEGLLSVQRSGT